MQTGSHKSRTRNSQTQALLEKKLQLRPSRQSGQLRIPDNLEAVIADVTPTNLGDAGTLPRDCSAFQTPELSKFAPSCTQLCHLQIGHSYHFPRAEVRSRVKQMNR